MIIQGGDMADITLRANDPLFFMFHAFVDMVVEKEHFILSPKEGGKIENLYYFFLEIIF
jgi:hypothetical protein